MNASTASSSMTDAMIAITNSGLTWNSNGERMRGMDKKFPPLRSMNIRDEDDLAWAIVHLAGNLTMQEVKKVLVALRELALNEAMVIQITFGYKENRETDNDFEGK